MGKVIKEIVEPINVVYRHVIHLRRGYELYQVMSIFKKFYEMPSIHWVLNCAHFVVLKPSTFQEDYYYFKIGAYSIDD